MFAESQAALFFLTRGWFVAIVELSKSDPFEPRGCIELIVDSRKLEPIRRLLQPFPDLLQT